MQETEWTRERIVCHAQRCVARVLETGAWAVDATAGAGHDTVFLARQVGAAGRVFALDTQREALARTRQRVQEAGMGERVGLLHAGHEAMETVLPPEAVGRLGAVMFNLGYLPGGDKAWITKPETTVAGLDAARRLLAPEGMLSVVAYPGHPGGAEESAAVRAWGEQRPAGERVRFVYAAGAEVLAAPWLMLVRNAAATA